MGVAARDHLQPLADVLGDRVRCRVRVTGVSRTGRDRVVDADRDRQPFTAHVENTDGTEERIAARAVIDASGTWSTPSPLGGNGLPALGEKAHAARITYRVPDAAQTDGGGCCAAPATSQIGIDTPAAAGGCR